MVGRWLEHETRGLVTIAGIVGGARLNVPTNATGACDAITGGDDEFARPDDAAENGVADAVVAQEGVEARRHATPEHPARVPARIEPAATLYAGGRQVHGDDAAGVADPDFLAILEAQVRICRRLDVDLDAPVGAVTP